MILNWPVISSRNATLEDIQGYCHGVREEVAEALLELLYDSDYADEELREIPRFIWQCLLDDARTEAEINRLG